MKIDAAHYQCSFLPFFSFSLPCKKPFFCILIKERIEKTTGLSRYSGDIPCEHVVYCLRIPAKSLWILFYFVLYFFPTSTCLEPLSSQCNKKKVTINKTIPFSLYYLCRRCFKCVTNSLYLIFGLFYFL